jgi:hypothetical protein
MNTNYYTHPLKIGTRLPDDSEIVKVYDMENEDKAILRQENGVTISEEKLKEIDLEDTNDENKQIFGYNQFLFEEGIIDVNNNKIPDYADYSHPSSVLQHLYPPYLKYYYKIRNNNRMSFSNPKFEKWKSENLNGYPDNVKAMRRIPLVKHFRGLLQKEHNYSDEEKNKINDLINYLKKGSNFNAFDYVKRIKLFSDLDIDNISRQQQLGGKKKKTKKRKTKKKSKKNTKTRRRKV